MSDHEYTAFGMRIHSEISLILPTASPEYSAYWPIEVACGSVPGNRVLPYSIGAIRYGLVGEAIMFDIPWAARYSVESDSRIVVDPADGAKEELPGLYLTGLILPLLLGKHDVLALHGSAVAGPSGCLVFIGDKGAGKSTTAAALSAFGYKIFCDDVIPVAPGSLVLPGIPFPKLLPDAYERLIGDPLEASRFFDGAGKYQARLPMGHVAVRLNILFSLETSDEPVLRIEPIKGGVKIHRIMQNSIMLQGIDDPVSLFLRCSERFSSTPCFRVIRPLVKDCLDELVGRIMELDKNGT